jgi:IS5 family transposase
METSEWRWFQRHSVIEPVMCHMKEGHRMSRNHLKGTDGDRSTPFWPREVPI